MEILAETRGTGGGTGSCHVDWSRGMGAGGDNVKRMVSVVTLMVVGISMLLWSGWHNLRERRLAMQRAEANHVYLTPATPGKPGEATEGQLPALDGKPAPAFALRDLEGKKVSLADYRGRPVLVNFWATWCAPCKLEMPWFEQFRKQYAGQGFEILGIAEDDAGKDEIAKSAHKLGVSYPILLGDDKVAPLYGGIDYLPMSFYVDRSGVVREETSGLGTKDEIEANIRKIVGSGAPATAGVVASAVGGQ